jgi:Leucine-rich repeat (LRR) protein
MKKLLLLLFLGFTLVGFSQTTLIPDPNFEQALIDLGYDTAPINGSVPTANISSVTFLDVRNKNISDLTGIEGFNTLTTLYCFGNQLTSLDVSNNTELNILDCQNNQLTSLDFSGATALTTLYCSFNQLTSLDFSGANALTSLSCSLNQLTSLDFNGANALTFLYCDFNPLTSLDVSNNIALTDLSCTDNQLTSLDLSNNTALTFLFCNRNQLTNLDIRNGNNEALIKIGAGENPNLTCIYVDDADYMNTNWADSIDPTSTFVENEAECEALSIGDNALELDVFIYPNPTDNYLFIEGNKNPIAVSIYNLLGAEVIATSATDKINVSELSKGVYIIRISDGVNQANKKLIIN